MDIKNEELLRIEGLCKDYSSKSKALTDVTLSLPRGQFVSVIGSSGAGKSTLLRCINRLIDPTAGRIMFEGKDIVAMNKRDLHEIRRRISMIFQHYNLVYRSTAIENVLQGRLGYKSTVSGVLGLYSHEEKERAFSILEQLGLSEFTYNRADQLSGGQKQRVGIARALLQDPSLMLADEPIASLDPKASTIIMNHLRRVVDNLNITCLVNLHQVDYAIEYSDRIIGLKQGRLIFDGTPNQLNEEVISELYGTSLSEEDILFNQAGFGKSKTDTFAKVDAA